MTSDSPSVTQQLSDEAYRFDFFQAVRVLQRTVGEAEGGKAETLPEPVGYDFAPANEAVRFRAAASHSFPAGAIRDVRPFKGPLEPGESRPPDMSAAFFGMTGPQGVLPRHYTSLLIERIRAKDFALRDFLDMFNHRLLSFFYRAWEKYRFAFAYERTVAHSSVGLISDRPAEVRLDIAPTVGQIANLSTDRLETYPTKRYRPAEDEDDFTHGLYCLVGLGTAGLRGRSDFDDEAVLFYAGHFAHYPRKATCLEGILHDYFELPIAVRQFQGQWLYLAVEDQSAMPSPRWPLGLHNSLGMDAVIGERVWGVESKFRVQIGPLYYVQFRRLIPCGDMLRPLSQMTRLYVGPNLEFDVQLILKAKEVPWCRLGEHEGDPAHLGWNTWVRSGDFTHDVYDAVFSVNL